MTSVIFILYLMYLYIFMRILITLRTEYSWVVIVGISTINKVDDTFERRIKKIIYQIIWFRFKRIGRWMRDAHSHPFIFLNIKYWDYNNYFMNNSKSLIVYAILINPYYTFCHILILLKIQEYKILVERSRFRPVIFLILLSTK